MERAEHHPKAQLAYSFDFSLQNEFSMKENLAIAREFIQKQFVDRGMIADYAVHLPDKGDAVPNPSGKTVLDGREIVVRPAVEETLIWMENYN